jgi:hypothetical protein
MHTTCAHTNPEHRNKSSAPSWFSDFNTDKFLHTCFNTSLFVEEVPLPLIPYETLCCPMTTEQPRTINLHFRAATDAVLPIIQ